LDACAHIVPGLGCDGACSNIPNRRWRRVDLRPRQKRPSLLLGLHDKPTNGNAPRAEKSRSESLGKPKEVAGGFVTISAGESHTCGLQADGSAFCWGTNGAGQLGFGTMSDSIGMPVPAGPGLKFSAISVGSSFTCGLLLPSGLAMCWGDNSLGQIGQPPATRSLSVPTPVAPNQFFKSISAGSDHVCAIDANDAISCWGNLATVGNPSASVPFSQVSAGTKSNCAIDKTGALHCWGATLRGSPQPAGTPNNSPALVTQVMSAVSVSVGTNAACAADASGQLFCWGDNSFGHLGAGPSVPLGSFSVTPVRVSGPQDYVAVSVGDQHACARTKAGGVRCWGSNGFEQLGLGLPISPSTLPSVAVPTDVVGLQSSMLVSGANHVCSVDAAGVTACWGDDLKGQLGDGGGAAILPSIAVVPVPVGRFFLKPLVHETLLLPPPSSLSTTLPLPGPGPLVEGKFSVIETIGQMDFSEIAVGGQHACAIGAGGAPYCWGSDLFGQIGDGTRQEVACGFGGPTLAACVPIPTLISNNLDHRFSHIGAGAAHNCGLALSGKIFCWGVDGAGELGVSMPCPSGLCFSRTPTEPVFTTPPSHPFEDVAGADGSTCAINNGEVFCWGQLGGGPTPVIERVSPPSLTPKAVSVGPGFACIRSHSAVAFRPDVLQCFGNGQFGELGDGNNASAASPQTVARDSIDPFHLNLHFACGVHLSVAFCWGVNSSGQLGNGTMMNSNVPVAVSLPGFSAASVGVGFNHACALGATGAMFCWGDNSAGQLGNGTTSPSLLPLTRPVPVAGGWKLP